MSEKEIPKACQQRHHHYVDGKCVGCDKPEKRRALFQVLTGGAALPAPGEAGGTEAPPAATPPPATSPHPAPPAAAPQPTTDADAIKLADWMAERTVFVVEEATRWAIERRGRRPNDPHPKTIEQLRIGLRRLYEKLFADTTLSPLAQTGLAFTFMLAEMLIGSEKIPRPAPPALNAAPDAGAPPPPAPASAPPADSASTEPPEMTPEEIEAEVLGELEPEAADSAA